MRIPTVWYLERNYSTWSANLSVFIAQPNIPSAYSLKVDFQILDFDIYTLHIFPDENPAAMQREVDHYVNLQHGLYVVAFLSYYVSSSNHLCIQNQIRICLLFTDYSALIMRKKV